MELKPLTTQVAAGSTALLIIFGLYQLVAGNFGDIEMKVLFTLLTLSASSLLLMPMLHRCFAKYSLQNAGMISVATSFILTFAFIWNILGFRDVTLDVSARVLLLSYIITFFLSGSAFMASFSSVTSSQLKKMTSFSKLMLSISLLVYLVLLLPLQPDLMFWLLLLATAFGGCSLLTLIIIGFRFHSERCCS